MREGKYLQVGALALGIGLSLSVVAPALAEDIWVVPTPDGTQAAVSSTTMAEIRAIYEIDPQAAFQAAFTACALAYDIDDCVEEVMANIGLEDETYVVVDYTPLNPVDTAADSTEEVGPIIGVNPPGL